MFFSIVIYGVIAFISYVFGKWLMTYKIKDQAISTNKKQFLVVLYFIVSVLLISLLDWVRLSYLPEFDFIRQNFMELVVLKKSVGLSIMIAAAFYAGLNSIKNEKLP